MEKDAGSLTTPTQSSQDRAVLGLLLKLILTIVGILAAAFLIVAGLFLLWSWYMLKSGTLAD